MQRLRAFIKILKVGFEAAHSVAPVNNAAWQVQANSMVAPFCFNGLYPLFDAPREARIFPIRPIALLDPIKRKLAAMERAVFVQEMLIDIRLGMLPQNIKDIDIIIVINPVVESPFITAGLHVAGVYAEAFQNNLCRVRYRMDNRHRFCGHVNAKILFQFLVSSQCDTGELSTSQIYRHAVRLLMVKGCQQPLTMGPSHFFFLCCDSFDQSLTSNQFANFLDCTRRILAVSVGTDFVSKFLVHRWPTNHNLDVAVVCFFVLAENSYRLFHLGH